MSPILGRVYSAPGGTEALDVLMKYMYVVTVTAFWLTRPLHLLPLSLGNRTSSLPPRSHDFVQHPLTLGDTQLQGHGTGVAAIEYT
jgi:hypothetical protein